ncbi:MAG: hypothetical protein V1905_03750 [bacterium]
MDKKIKKQITLDDLATMIANGFNEVGDNFKGNRQEHERIFKILDNHTARLDNLEQGQEEIRLKLDQVAYRFEVEELNRRLRLVEMKLGIKSGVDRDK